ncbi:MAG: N-acetylmuramoyl-L-alanine amidase [Bacteroidetes bacterium]|nr:N-acetylmuramoyl-L-alanine amidase [Bacteroidota bacterium]
MKRPGIVILLGVVLLLASSFIPPHRYSYVLKKVVIDAGHGGHDSGCLGKKTKEKDVALAIALKLGEYIEANFKDVKVIYTRKTDVFVELFERAAIANNAKADLFICIHCNSACVYDKRKKKDICNDEPNGVETWVMGLHKSEANLDVAKRENKVVLLEKDYKKQYDGFDPNSPEANIIFSLYQNTFLDQSLHFASNVEEETGKKGREKRGVKQAGFLVLYKTYMPSVLIETGFLSNLEEEKYLSSEKGQDNMAHSIFNAFRNYKNSVESNTGDRNADEVPLKQMVKPGEDTAMKADREKDSIPTVQKTEPEEKMNADHEKNPGPLQPKKDELIFAVQLVLSPGKLPAGDRKLKGMKDIREEKAGGTYKYSSGNFTSLNDAISYQGKMREKGFKDAFVIAFRNGARISMKEAREILLKK